MAIDAEVREIAESLECMKLYLKQATHKKLMVETLTHLFLKKTTNVSEVWRAINSILVSEGYEEVSLKYVQSIAAAKKQKDMNSDGSNVCEDIEAVRVNYG